MGAEYIDYMFGQTLGSEENVEDWASTRPFITEKIAYVPSMFTYDRQRQVSDEPLTREQYGLPETGFVFTCQNGCQKLMPEVFDIWMEILKAVPGSVLWLLKPNDTAVKNLIKEADARGVDAERLIFTAREVVPLDQEKARIGKYLASYKLADLFLDTWPYNAGTTAVDALWAGLPVLTKKGKALVARMATEALRGIEVPELITKTPEEYKELAIELAHNPDKLKQIKEKVQRNRLTTALFDPVANTRHIESAYLEMYRRYQESSEPQDFIIEAQNAN
jgi:predicted O-linked N-acetylglucosamine transferase (SPINDLY family)